MLFQRYRILGELGVGGMGSVYLAEQTGPGGFRREVVLKMLRINGAVSEDQRLMLLDEAQLTGLISHPNVIVLHEAGEHQGLLFLALERVRGVSLSELLRRLPSRKLPIAIAAGLVAQACAGLHAAHEWQHEGRPLDLVHRDVSMSNLMCDINGRVRVIDFGIARANVIRRAATDSHLVRGNPAYMAPEQFLGGPLDRRVDIYSTALVFYELCAGEHPFKQKAQRSVVPPLSNLCPEIPRALDALIAACLDLEPSARPPHIGSLGHALKMVAQAQGAAEPAALARYFHELGLSLEPAAPRPANPAAFPQARRPVPPPPPPRPDPPESDEATRPRRVARSLQIRPDDPDLLEWHTEGGQRLFIHLTRLQKQGQPIGLSDILPAPVFALQVGGGLRLSCDESSSDPFSRSSLYVDAFRSQTRLPYLLLTAGSGTHSFDVGHRRSLVRHVSVVFGERSGQALLAWLPEYNLEIMAPRNAELLVVLASQDEACPHLDCIYI
jgi:serine/threonine protein kinase